MNTCRLCGHQELRVDFLVLHLGRAHEEALRPEERTAFEVALEEEAAGLQAVGRHVKAGLAVTPVALFYFFTVLAILASNGNVGLAFLGLPGIVAFSGFVYFLVYTRDSLPSVPGRAPPLDEEGTP